MPSLIALPGGNEKSTMTRRFDSSLGTVIKGLKHRSEIGDVWKGPNMAWELTFLNMYSLTSFLKVVADKWLFWGFLIPKSLLQFIGMPYFSRLTTICSLGEMLGPKQALILSCLIAVGIGILQPWKLNKPDSLTLLCTQM